MARLHQEGRPPGLALWLADEPVRVTVTGSSMEPTLRDGDGVAVVRAAREELRRGDLMVFERAGEVTVHRFLGGKGDRFLEKGDAHALGAWRPWPEALGKVVAVWPAGASSSPRPLPASTRRSLGRRHLLRHLLTEWAGALPGALLRRAALGLLRRLPDRLWNGDSGIRTETPP